MTLQEHFDKAVEEIKKGHSWSDAQAQYALEVINEYRCPIYHADNDIADEISEFMDNYGEVNGLPEDWWYEWSEDDVFFKL